MIMKETMVFLFSCLLGAGYGAFYDAFRIIRLVFPHNKPMIFMQDVFYFFIITLFSFSFFLSQTNGIVRGFVLFGELMGMVLYFFTLSILVMKSATAIISAIKKLLSLLFSIFIKPFLRLFRWIITLFCSLFSFCTKKITLKRKIDLN